MEPMKSVSGLCALLFGLSGGAFVLMGAVFGLLKVPVRGAVHSGWAFVPLGLACLLLALACAGLACRRHRREARLRAAGIPVAAGSMDIWTSSVNSSPRFFAASPARTQVSPPSCCTI